MSKLEMTFLVNFSEFRAIALMAAKSCALPNGCTFTPLYTIANEPDPNFCCSVYPATTLTRGCGGGGCGGGAYGDGCCGGGGEFIFVGDGYVRMVSLYILSE